MLRYLWASPNTLIGLVLALGGLAGGGRARVFRGVLEVHGPGIRLLLGHAGVSVQPFRAPLAAAGAARGAGRGRVAGAPGGPQRHEVFDGTPGILKDQAAYDLASCEAGSLIKRLNLLTGALETGCTTDAIELS